MSKSIYSIISDPEVLLSLEPEELAGTVLEYLNSLSDSENGQLNRSNFTNPSTVTEYPPESQNEILQALMEAWIWLEREGLIAPKPGYSEGNFVFITRRGSLLKKAVDLDTYRKSDILPKRLLDPKICTKVWSAFIRGEYDTAVFQAFKEVEVAVRNAGNFSPTDIDISLMRTAFSADGPLTDSSLPKAEQESLQHLFAGAIGSYKNPMSHRNVTISDPTEAVEMIILASHLIRIVDSRSMKNKE